MTYDVGHGLKKDPKDPRINDKHREHVKKAKEHDAKENEHGPR